MATPSLRLFFVSYSLQFAVAIFCRGNVCAFLEKTAERCLVGKAESYGNLLYGELALVSKQEFCLRGNVFAYPSVCRDARQFFYYSRKMLWGKIEQRSIEVHLMRLCVMTRNGVVELSEELVLRAFRRGSNAILLSVLMH